MSHRLGAKSECMLHDTEALIHSLGDPDCCIAVLPANVAELEVSTQMS
jgi:hypothetical protein